MSECVREDVPALRAGDSVGDHEILEILGAGGMGCVYKARHTITQRLEALKVMRPEMEGHPERLERFLREIRVAASLHHPNIARLLTARRDRGRVLMLMEFVDGEPLSKALRRRLVSLGDALRYAMQLLDALHYAHCRNVVHRDLKPANVLVTPAGQAVLTDFGIALATQDHRLTQVGVRLGSIDYMSPEQVQGIREIDWRTDLYSMGVLLYEMIAGQRPITGPTEFAIAVGHVHTPPRALSEAAPGVPAAISECVMKALAKEPEARYQSAAAMRSALLRALPLAA